MGGLYTARLPKGMSRVIMFEVNSLFVNDLDDHCEPIRKSATNH